MQEIVGQAKLLSYINNLNIKSSPKSTLLIGPKGCGKYTFSKLIADKLNLEIFDLSEVSSSDLDSTLKDCYSYPLSRIYLLDLSKIDLKNQNRFLKFVEEPIDSMFIILLAESEIGVLPTILNRCRKIYFEKYSKEELQQLSWAPRENTDLIYELCETPGQLLDFDTTHLEEARILCDTIITKSKLAPYANIMKISLKINCKDDFSKIDFNLFFKLLAKMSFDYYKETNDEFSFKLYLLLLQMRVYSLGCILIKENFLLSFLDKLYEVSRA